MDDNKFWLGVWIVVGASITLLGVICATYVHNEEMTALNNGMHEQQEVGSSGTMWVY